MALLALTASAQKDNYAFTVKGLAADSLTRQGEPYATVTLAADSALARPVATMVTSAKGAFTIRHTGSGPHTLSVASMGRETAVRHFTINRDRQAVRLDTILLSEAHNVLQGVEVVARKPLVKADLDKIAYSVEDDPDAQTNSTLEMLRKVPLVTVDGQDNIKVNGSSNFKIHINGKPNNMVSNNPVEVLKGMPANTIRRIEVITNPGPKYDAEGVGGILNIVTHGSGFEGYTATLSARANNRGLGGSAFGTAKVGKFTVSANYSYSYSDNPRSTSTSTNTVTAGITDASANISSASESRGHSNFHHGSMEASYEIDSLNLITMQASLYSSGGYSRNGTNTEACHPTTAENLYRYATDGGSHSSWTGFGAGIDYQKLFSVKDRILTFSYKIDYSPGSSDSWVTYGDMWARPVWEQYVNSLDNQRLGSDQRSAEHTLQADYSTPLGKAHTLEGGLKYILRNNSAENDRHTRPANSQQDYTFDHEHSTHYKHRNDIMAAYLGYGLKWKKMSARLGLRYEHTMQDVKYLLGRGDDFKEHFNDWVPSASLGLKLGDMANIKLNYNMRISRPSIWHLNPYLNDADPTSLYQGNPNLESEKNHQLTLSYGLYTPKLSLSTWLSGSLTNNSIESYTRLMRDNDIAGITQPTGKDVYYTTYGNMGTKRSAMCSAYINWNITPQLSFYTNAFASYMYIDDGKDLSNHGWFAYYYSGMQYATKSNWRFSGSIFGQTPYIALQGRYNSYLSYSFSITKQMLDKRLSVSAFATDIFGRHRTSKTRLEGTNYIQRNAYRQQKQSFGLSISYRLGELKASVKKAQRTISNDDVKSGGKK